MSNFLQSLASGLRLAGGVLSPKVQQETFAADQQRAMAEQRFKQALVLQQTGPQAMFARAKMQQMQQEQARRQQIAADIQALPPGKRADPLSIAEIFMKNGDYERGAKHLEAFDQMQQRRQTSLWNMQARLAQIEQRAQDKSLDRATRLQISNDANTTRMAIADLQHQIQQGQLEVKRLNGGIKHQQVVQNEARMRQQFSQASKNFINVRDAHQRVLASARDPSAAGDMALIFNYMKVLDPTSVVRESEFANAAKTGAFGERIKAGVEWVLRGERLSTKMRQDFVDRSNKLYVDAETNQKKLEDQYTGIAKRSEADPQNVVIPYRISGGNGNLPQVKTDADYEALPSGAEFIDPEGNKRRKP